MWPLCLSRSSGCNAQINSKGIKIYFTTCVDILIILITKVHCSSNYEKKSMLYLPWWHVLPFQNLADYSFSFVDLTFALSTKFQRLLQYDIIFQLHNYAVSLIGNHCIKHRPSHKIWLHPTRSGPLPVLLCYSQLDCVLWLFGIVFLVSVSVKHYSIPLLPADRSPLHVKASAEVSVESRMSIW